MTLFDLRVSDLQARLLELKRYCNKLEEEPGSSGPLVTIEKKTIIESLSISIPPATHRTRSVS